MLRKKYNISYDIKGIVRSSNPIVGAMQKYFAAFKLQSVSDVINLDRLDNYIKE